MDCALSINSVNQVVSVDSRCGSSLDDQILAMAMELLMLYF
jgi:hypothetical protein